MHEDTDLHRVLGALHQARAALDLDTAHLCYLIALRVRAERGNLASLTEDDLVDLYLQVCELIDPDADNPRLRATRAIQHLRDHRLLRRVDGAGLVRAGEYTLTRLAVAIVDFFVEDETLTRESLVVLTRALTSQLGAVLADARKAETEASWRSDVVEPLRVTVSDLVSGIERRQRGMDAQQEEVRERIGALLQEDWFAAVGDCEQLLNDTSTTLRELNEVLLRDSAHLHALLQDIEQVATEASAEAAVIQAQKVQEHLDRVAAWGGDRQRAWSDYYQFVQRYLRGVVRMDPDRAVSQRLRARGEMLVGQGLALMYLDPASVKAAGVVPVAQLLEVLANLVGQDRLIVTLSFRKRPPKDARIAEESARKEVAKALRGLERLGFVERLADDQLRLRTPLMRFADPVRGLTEPTQALARLIERGEVVAEAAEPDDDLEGNDEADQENGE